MDKVTFYSLNDWAIVPKKEQLKLDKQETHNLRWFNKKRVKGACWPYKLAKELGWVVCSPIDITIEPVKEVQVSVEDQHELEELQQLLQIDFWVKREDIFIGVKPDGWFRVHQSKVNGIWHSMFVPNGEGSFEWKMGWSLEIPKDFVLLIQPLEGEEDFIVHPGLLTAKKLPSFNHGLGLPLAFEPKKKREIRRGDPLAKIFVFHKSALTLKEEVVVGNHEYQKI